MQQFSPPAVFNLTPRTQLCLSEVVYLESSRNYTYLFFADGNRLLLSKTLGDLWQCLSAQQFLRISRTHVVNVNFLSKICQNSDTPLAILRTNVKLPVSRRRLKQINFL